MNNAYTSIHVLATNIQFPEGPVFTADGTLWCVEQHGESLIQLTGNRLFRHQVGGNPNGLALSSNNILWYCDSGMNAIRTFHPINQLAETIVSHLGGKPLFMPNDLCFDPYGNLLFTCPGPALDSDEGYICCLSAAGELSVIADHKNYPNGLVFDPKGSTLLIAETGKKQIWAGDWDPLNKSWSNTRLFTDTGGEVGPDGMAFDENGNLYVAVYGTGAIKIYTSTGQYLNSIYLPGKNPTNCAFDPTGRLGLVITEAQRGEIISIPLPFKGIMQVNL
ncbi:gluconolactonase [bacterium A37T11]|nr:gluconolactonase [bacterium A37T11]